MAKALREKKAGVETQIEEYRDKITADGYEVTSEDRESFKRMKNEYTGLETETRELEEMDSILAKRNQDPNSDLTAQLRLNPKTRQLTSGPSI